MKIAQVKEDTREAILDAVKALIIRYGYRKMTVDDIAREARIGKGSVYLYFSSKEEMALSVIDRTSLKILENLRKIVASRDAPPDKLRQFLFERVITRIDAVQACTEGLDELYAAIRPKLLQQREHYQAAEATILQEALNAGKVAGSFFFDNAEETAHAFLHATNSFLPHSLSAQQLGERKELITKLECLTNILLFGVARKESVNG